MSGKRDKSAEELAHVRLLCQNLPDFAPFELEPLPAPEPDVLIKQAESRIGVEVTEIHGNPRLRMIEGEQDKVLDRTEREWAERDLPPVAVWVHWLPTLLPRRLAQELPGRLVDLIAARLPPKPASLEIDGPEISEAIGDSCVEHLFVYTDWEPPSDWNWGRRWWGGTVGPELIQREIDRKNSKIANYCGSFAERWLLLVHPGGVPSSGFDLSPHISQAQFQSTFDRVYLLSLIGPKVRQLQLRSSGRSSNER